MNRVTLGFTPGYHAEPTSGLRKKLGCKYLFRLETNLRSVYSRSNAPF